MKKLVIYLSSLTIVISSAHAVTLSGTAVTGAEDNNSNLIGSGWASFIIFSTGDSSFVIEDNGLFSGQTLETGTFFLGSDDFVIANNPTTVVNTVAGNVTYNLGDNLNGDIAGGDPFAILFFDSRANSSPLSPVAGDNYGFVKAANWVSPSNNSDAWDFGVELTQLSGSSANLAVVPEPASYAMIFGLLGLGMALVRRRRRG